VLDDEIPLEQLNNRGRRDSNLIVSSDTSFFSTSFLTVVLDVQNFSSASMALSTTHFLSLIRDLLER